MKGISIKNNISKIIKHNKTENNDKKLEQNKISKVIEMKKRNIYALSSEYICTNKKKFMLIDFIIMLIIIFYIYRFIFIKKDTFSNKFLNEMHNQYRRYIHNELNLIVLFIFIILMISFSSIELHEFQSLSIVLFVTFITSIFQKGDAFVLSASIAGIFVYVYYRIKIFFYNKQHNINCQKIIQNRLHIPINNQY